MKRKRIKRIPLSICNNMDDITPDKEIINIESYVKTLNKHDYLIDLLQTSDNKYYCKFTDITDNIYEEVDFEWMKQKYSSPTLFDYLGV